MLSARGIGVRVNGRDLLTDVDIDVPCGMVTALIGPNGAGKSTLLKVLSGERRPTNGTTTYGGMDVYATSAGTLAARRAVVPQASHLAFPFTVLEVVSMGALVPGFGCNSDDVYATARTALFRVGLTAFGGRLYNRLSGGEQQRVHIARALCQLETARERGDGQQYLLLDEPTASLDLTHQSSMAREFRRQADDGRAVLMVAHDLNLAAAIADAVVVLDGGQVAARGTVGEVYREDLLSTVYRCPLRLSEGTSSCPAMVLPDFRVSPISA